MDNERPTWPWYLLGGVGLVLVALGAIEAALAVWQGVPLIGVLFMLLSAVGWFLFKYAELSATSGSSRRSI